MSVLFEQAGEATAEDGYADGIIGKTEPLKLWHYGDFHITVTRYSSTNLRCSIIRCETMALTIGTQLGSHEITGLLGKGGMDI
jgi:hypothetical protein